MSSLAAAGVALGALLVERQRGAGYSAAFVPALVIDFSTAGFWSFVVSQASARVPAFAYSERLLGAADQLPRGPA